MTEVYCTAFPFPCPRIPCGRVLSSSGVVVGWYCRHCGSSWAVSGTPAAPHANVAATAEKKPRCDLDYAPVKNRGGAVIGYRCDRCTKKKGLR